MTTTNQRILDLLYAGHGAPDVANLMGVDESDVQTAAQNLSAFPTSQGAGPAASTPVVVSATPQQDQTGLPSEVYVSITGHAAGTVTVAIGPTSGVADTIIPAEDASLTHTVRFRLPASWWFEVTVAGSAAIASAKQITG